MITETMKARKNLHRVGEPCFDSSAGRMRIYIDDEQRMYSHYVWFLNTGHWPAYPDEVIHHIDGDPTNDSFNNLQLMSDFEHKSLHMSGENHWNFGKTPSEETRAKLRAAQAGKNNHRWKGDAASADAKYRRHRLYPNLYPPLTDAEREELRAYQRERYREKVRRSRTLKFVEGI